MFERSNPFCHWLTQVPVIFALMNIPVGDLLEFLTLTMSVCGPGETT